MKTITLICNCLLLGLVFFGIITSGIHGETPDRILILLVSGVSVVNLLIISGSKIHIDFISSIGGSQGAKRTFNWSLFLTIKISAIILNIIVLLLMAYLMNRNQNLRPSLLERFILLFPVATLIISALTILACKWNRFGGLKRTILVTGISLFVLISVPFFTFRTLIGKGIKENISIAKKEYPGKAEDALLAYLADSTKTPRERTEIAVWTLGQIRSGKALPILKSLYKDDSLSKSFKYDSKFNQYEIHKAIVSIESNWLGAPEKNVFGSWTRLNK